MKLIKTLIKLVNINIGSPRPDTKRVVTTMCSVSSISIELRKLSEVLTLRVFSFGHQGLRKGRDFEESGHTFKGH